MPLGEDGLGGYVVSGDTIESLIYNRLSNYGGLTALIGIRIYPLMIPQEQSLPSVTYFIVSNIPEHAMGNDADIVTVRLQVSSWSTSYKMAKAVAAQVKAALSRYRSSPILDIFLDNEMDQFESDVEEYVVISDFIVFYSEA